MTKKEPVTKRIKSSIVSALRSNKKIKCIHLGKNETEEINRIEEPVLDKETRKEIIDNGAYIWDIKAKTVNRPNFFRVYYN